MTVAAVIAVALLGVITAFQVALALGAPLGAAAWGGQHPGVLPRRLRIGSGIAAVVVYPMVILLVLDAARIVDVGWLPVRGAPVMWALTALLGIGALANFASRSPPERVWGPVALAVAVCCAVIALGA